MKTHTNYNVCPITGITNSIRDDYSSVYLFGAAHPITAQPNELFTLVEKTPHKLPKSYIAGAILLQLAEEELIEHPEHEKRMVRGYANELLQTFPHHELIELYWDVRNTKAGIISIPLKVNLTTSVSQGRHAVYDNIKCVGCQDVSVADMVTYITTRTNTYQGTLSPNSKPIHLQLDIVACLKRVTKDLPILAQSILDIPSTDTKVEGYNYTWAMLLMPKGKGSLAKVRNMLYRKETGACYHLHSDTIKAKLIAILKQIVRGD